MNSYWKTESIDPDGPAICRRWPSENFNVE